MLFRSYHYSLQSFKKGVEKELYGNFSQEYHCIHLDCGRVLEAKSSLGKRVNLSLRLVAGADGYIIERSESKDGEYTQVGKLDSGLSLRFIDKAPKALKTYYYRCKAFKEVEGQIFESVASAPKTVRVKL